MNQYSSHCSSSFPLCCCTLQYLHAFINEVTILVPVQSSDSKHTFAVYTPERTKQRWPIRLAAATELEMHDWVCIQCDVKKSSRQDSPWKKGLKVSFFFFSISSWHYWVCLAVTPGVFRVPLPNRPSGRSLVKATSLWVSHFQVWRPCRTPHRATTCENSPTGL